MAGHSDRAHALLSASGAHRWLCCTPSALLEAQFPDTGSEAAKEGTLAHELAEARLMNYFKPKVFTKRMLSTRITKLRKDPLWADEMIGCTETYLDAVKEAALGFDSSPYAAIEKKVDLSEWIPEGFGTADCVMISGSVLHVFDYKHGKGVPVAAAYNPQMQLYALGAWKALRILYDVRIVRMTIVQPRIDNIDTWEIPIEELIRFGEFVKDRAALAVKGDGEFVPGEQQCRFCRARAQCRARAEENARLAFGKDAPAGKLPPLITNEEVGKYLRIGEDVARWLADLKEYALGECLAGRDIPGWKAVEGRGSRDWVDMDAAFRKLIDSGLTEEAMLWEKKPLTLAQVEKLVGKKEFAAAVGDLTVKNPGKPALVVESDKREAITNRPTAAEAFG